MCALACHVDQCVSLYSSSPSLSRDASPSISGCTCLLEQNTHYRDHGDIRSGDNSSECVVLSRAEAYSSIGCCSVSCPVLCVVSVLICACRVVSSTPGLCLE